MPLHEVSCCTKHKFANEGESGEHAESQNSSSKGFTVTNPEKRYAPHLHIEPKHLDISIDATHLEQKLVDIKLTYLLENNTVGASNITFNGLDFADVKVSGDGKPDWTYDGKELQVCFSEPFGAVHEKKSLTIAYRVAHPLVGLHFSVPDEKYPQRPLFAMTDHETEKARYWLACVDYPTVRTSLAYHITAKKGLVVVANGLHEKDEELDVTRVTSHWRLEQRCPSYLICWAVGDFQIEHDKDVHGIPIAYVAPRNVPREVLRSSFAATPSIMNFLETRLGVPFPFPKYYQIAVPGVLGGAMENITLTSWSVFFLCDETWGKEFQLSLDEVNVHEMAHSYFGDSVVMRHFEHVWLKESWATYMESAWLEQHRGDDEFRYEMYSNLNSYVSETNSYVRPMVERRYDHSWDMYDSHTYPGGAWRIHMLRRLLGDDAFWAGVKDYLTTYAGRVVETDDFRKCLEKFSGTNLTKFFDQWYYSAGFPKLKGSYEYKKETNRVKVTLEQTQVDEKSGVALFDIAPIIEIVDEAGKVYRATLVFEGARGSVVVQLEGKPVSVVVDPDYSLLHTLDFNPGTELLKHTLTHSSSMPHRVWAAKELIKACIAYSL
jgi:aminopeptidase N